MDKNNPIIKLVNEGMKMEREGKNNLAEDLYIQAWKKSSNDHEKCISAHFVARHQDSLEDTLKWNGESLDRANKINSDEVAGYYPSLYLNMACSWENLGNLSEAKRYINLAFDKIENLPKTKSSEGYSDGIRKSIFEVKQRIG